MVWSAPITYIFTPALEYFGLLLDNQDHMFPITLRIHEGR